jgi:hypothetical protein
LKRFQSQWQISIFDAIAGWGHRFVAGAVKDDNSTEEEKKHA